MEQKQDIQWLRRSRKPIRELKETIPLLSLYAAIPAKENSKGIRGHFGINRTAMEMLSRDGLVKTLVNRAATKTQWRIDVGVSGDSIYITEGNSVAVSIRNDTLSSGNGALQSIRDWADSNISTETLRFIYRGAIEGVARFELFAGEELPKELPEAYRVVNGEGKIIKDNLKREEVMPSIFSPDRKEPFQLQELAYVDGKIGYKSLTLQAFFARIGQLAK